MAPLSHPRKVDPVQKKNREIFEMHQADIRARLAAGEKATQIAGWLNTVGFVGTDATVNGFLDAFGMRRNSNTTNGASFAVVFNINKLLAACCFSLSRLRRETCYRVAWWAWLTTIPSQHWASTTKDTRFGRLRAANTHAPSVDSTIKDPVGQARDQIVPSA